MTGTSFEVGGFKPIDRRYQLATPTLSGSTLPTTGTQDGAMLNYAADTSTDWVFRYDAATAYWRFVGGPPLSATHATTSTGFISVASTWTDAGTNGPQITPPFAGDYAVTLQARVDNNSGTSPTMCMYAPSPVGSAPGGPVAAISLVNTAGVNFYSGSVTNVLVGLVAGTKVDLWGWTAAAAPAGVTFINMVVTMIPIRVH